jgi:gamma-glutamylcyclotransferase (GGCT)/AIG2-like uncharacterized protein YtfP
MPHLFSYGSLQEEGVQLTTFGRRLLGHRDELPRFVRVSLELENPDVVVANVVFDDDEASRVPGTVYEISDDELASVDAFEAPFAYHRIAVTLTSGQEAWVYVHAG